VTLAREVTSDAHCCCSLRRFSLVATKTIPNSTLDAKPKPFRITKPRCCTTRAPRANSTDAEYRLLFSLPLLVKYDPAVIQIQGVQDGGFLSGGTEAVAIVRSINAQKGEAMISCTRRHSGNGAAGGAIAGVNGSGTILGLVVRAAKPGESKIQIVEVQAQDSQQEAIPVITGEAMVRVQ
jgi:hypothetical protein